MRHRRIRVIAPLATLVAVLSCGGAEGIAPPTSAAIPSRADSTLLAGLIVSGPVANPVSASDRSAAGPTTAPSAQVSYVSLLPGTVADGTTVTIANLRNGQRVALFLVDGGFDPQAIPASLGDTLQVVVSRRQPEAVAYMAVAPRLSPRILHTLPLRGQTDAPLNTIITLVFSEPLDPASVTPTSVTLSAGPLPIAGAVRVPGPGYIVEFTPSELLVANTTYSLSVSGVANLAGTVLPTPASLTFTTGTSPTPDFAASMTISPDSTSMDLGEFLQMTATLRYATGEAVVMPSGMTWTSSSTDIAGVDCCGRLLGIGAGTAVITAKTQDRHVGTARITVKAVTGPVGAIVFAACAQDSFAPCGLYAVDPDGSKGQFLTGGTLDGDPVWSPDGTSIAFRSRRACRATLVCPNDLYLMKGDGSGIRSLTAGRGLDVGGISWSPDGRRIVFAASGSLSDQYAGEALYVMNADGTGLQILVSVPPGGTAAWPDWSPDGSKIAYNVAAPDGLLAINVVDADGSNDVRISSAPKWNNVDVRPHWSPDGRRIAFMRDFASDDCCGDHFAAFVMGADGSNVTQITPDLQSGNISGLGLAWSPDGTTLALDSGEGGVGVVNADGSGGIRNPLPSVFQVFSGISWRRAATAVPVPAQSRVRP